MINDKVLLEARSMIAGFLKSRRLELGLTQVALAEKCGFAFKTINAMENGHYWLGMKQYLIICEALHLFPTFAEIESEEPIARAIREIWKAKPKDMTLEDALKLKAQKHNREGQNN